MVLGVGLGLLTSPTSAVALGAVPLDNVGEASGITNVVRYIAGALGVALCSLVYSASSDHKLRALLQGVQVNAVETKAIEGMIAGVRANSSLALSQVDPRQMASFMADAKTALLDGFATVAMVLAILAFVGALVSHLLIRERPN